MEQTTMDLRTHHDNLVRVSTVSALAIGLLVAFAPGAKAACPTPRPRVSGVAWADGLRARSQASALSLVQIGNEEREPSIVGLWKVDILADGQVIDQGFDAWHGDGTETLNDAVPPTTGNVCLGVWERTGRRTYKLKHLSWNYDANGAAIGFIVIREQVKLDRSGHAYDGTYTYAVYDLTETLQFESSGELHATRIIVD